jgi:hypothetical protein
MLLTMFIVLAKFATVEFASPCGGEFAVAAEGQVCAGSIFPASCPKNRQFLEMAKCAYDECTIHS